MAGQKAKGSKKNRKHGRSKRKDSRRGSVLSLFVRGKISAKDYWNVIGIFSKAE